MFVAAASSGPSYGGQATERARKLTAMSSPRDTVQYRMMKRSQTDQVQQNDPNMKHIVWDFEYGHGLSTSGVRDDELVRLADAMAQNTCLQDISIKGNKLANSSISKLSKALKKCGVVNVHATDTNLSPKDLGKIKQQCVLNAMARVQADDMSLAAIDWRNSRITDEDVIKLTKVLRGNTHLTHLNLSGNRASSAFRYGVTDQAGKALEVVMPHCGLLDLDLR
jgi:hypothetical protein